MHPRIGCSRCEITSVTVTAQCCVRSASSASSCVGPGRRVIDEVLSRGFGYLPGHVDELVDDENAFCEVKGDRKDAVMMRVVAIGAGIGGPTRALALHAREIEVAVLQKTARLERVGAGIRLSPNANQVLAPPRDAPSTSPAPAPG